MASVVKGSSIVSASKEQVSTPMGKETVLLHMKTGKYFSLNRVGGFVWEKLQSDTTVDAIVDAVVQQFDVEKVRCESDVIRIVEGLLNAGFVELR